MENIIGIWHDAEVFNGRGTRTEFVHEPIYMQGPVNKRDVPCTGCPNYSTCAKEVVECSAFRNWSGRGDYKDSDVMRFIRAVKE
jgi:hypothetical protein